MRAQGLQFLSLNDFYLFAKMSKKNPTYAEAVSEIEEIIERIENNEFDIDELSQNVKRVADLLQFCKAKLKSTEDEVDKILKSFKETQ